jgi:hypothetical protein
MAAHGWSDRNPQLATQIGQRAALVAFSRPAEVPVMTRISGRQRQGAFSKESGGAAQVGATYSSVAGTSTGRESKFRRQDFRPRTQRSKPSASPSKKYEAENGKVSREVGPKGKRIWAFSLGDIYETGYHAKAEAQARLRRAIERLEVERSAQAARQAKEAIQRLGPPFNEYFAHW